MVGSSNGSVDTMLVDTDFMDVWLRNSQQNNRLFLFFFELMDLFVAGRDQSAADQPNNLAEGHFPL